MDTSERSLDSQSSVGTKKVEQTLVRLQEENLHQLLQLFLCFELGKGHQDAESCQIASSLLKKSLNADVKMEALVKEWHSVQDVALKSLVKERLLESLGSSLLESRQTSAQVIAMVASVEIPLNNWPQLVESMVSNMTQQSSLPHLKQLTLEILGYVCKNLHHHLKQDEVDSVIAVILQGMNQSENTPEVSVKATTVLFDALHTFKRKFENEMDRTHIINVVCETAFSDKADIQQAAFGCLVSIATNYYRLSGKYMERLVKVITSKVEDEESVALQAIEFWSSICEFEIHYQPESLDSGGSSPPQFIKKALPRLVSMLLGRLRKPEKDTNHYDDVLRMSMAARECLCLVSRRDGDEIVPLVIPFILTNIKVTTSWRDREAAISAFGEILDGSTINKLSPYFPDLLRFLLAAIKDENKDVRVTNDSTLNRILHFSYSPESGASSDQVVEIFEEITNNEQYLPEPVRRVLSLSFMMIRHRPQTAQSQSPMETLQQHQRVTDSDITVSASEQLQQSQSQPTEQQKLQSQSPMKGVQQHQRVTDSDITLSASEQLQRSQTAQSQSPMENLQQHLTGSDISASEQLRSQSQPTEQQKLQSQSPMKGVQQHQRVTDSDITLSASEQLQRSQTAQSQSPMEKLQQHLTGSDITVSASEQLRSQSQPTEQQKLQSQQSQTAQPRPQQSRVREKLTVSEMKSLVKLMPLVQNFVRSSGQPENKMWGVSLLEEEESQAVLLKFLRAKDFDVDESLKMIKNTLEWRSLMKIDELCEGQSVGDHSPSIFIYGHDREGRQVVYDNVYKDFPKEIFSDMNELKSKVSDFLKSRIIFMEMTLRKLGGDSSFLYIHNVRNEHGLTKEDLKLVTELTREELKQSQKSYPNFATTQLFINCSWMEYLYYQISSVYMFPRSKREVVLAQTSETVETLLKYVKPNEIPSVFGGLSVNAEDISSEDIVSAISIKAGKRKTVEMQCPKTCELTLTFRSTGNCLVYESVFIPGTFRTVVGQTSFTPGSDNHEFTDIEALVIEPGLLRHSFKVTEPGKLVVAGNNPTSSKAMLLCSYRVNYNVN